MAGNQVEPVHGFDSLLIGENAAFLDEQYRAWLDDPGSVAPQWAAMFERLEPADGGWISGPTFRPRSIFHPSGGARVAAAELDAATERESRVVQLINAYRVRGHL